MGDDDKPFACTEPGCGNRFATEDHLNMHKLKHSMSLALSSGGGNLYSSAAIFADQTPTPTKFLRYGEEIGLFHELTKSPFDEAFRKANTLDVSTSHTHETVPLPGPSNGDTTLHTPIPGLRSPQTETRPVEQTPDYIPLPGPPDIGSTLGDSEPLLKTDLAPTLPTAMDLRVSSSTSSPAKKRPRFPLAEDSTHKLLSPQDNKPLPRTSTSEPLIVVDDVSSQSEEELVVDGPLSVQSTDLLPDDSSNVATTLPQLATIPVTTPTVAQPTLQNASTVIIPAAAPTAVVTQASTAVLKPAAAVTTHVMQVMLQLPNGQTIPVQIPAAITPQAVSPIGSQATTNVSSTTSAVKPFVIKQEPSSSTGKINVSASTKQKLKQTLTQNLQNNSNVQSIVNSSMQIKTEVVEGVPAQPQPQPQPQPNRAVTILRSPLVSPSIPEFNRAVIIHTAPNSTGIPRSTSTSPQVQTQAADTSTPFSIKRTRKSSEDDPDERRRKFLERNRAAAARCRQKRKTWIGGLENKAEELQNLNSKLQTEVTFLRGEVAQLKSLLLAHKDCPIFTKQTESGQISLEPQSLGEEEEDCVIQFDTKVETPTLIPPTPRIISAAASSSGILSLQGPLAVVNAPNSTVPTGNTTITIVQQSGKKS